MVTEKDIEKFKAFIKEYVEKNKRGYPVKIRLKIGNKEKKAQVLFVATKKQKEKLMSHLIPAIEISELDSIPKQPANKQEEEAYKIIKEAFDTIKALSEVKKIFNGKIIKTEVL